MQTYTQFSPELKNVWDAAYEKITVRYPFYRYGWHEAWHTTLGKDKQLFIAKDPDSAVVIPLFREESAARFTGGEETADYLDAIGPEDAKASAWEQVLPLMQSSGITTVHLRNIPERSQTLAFFRARNAQIDLEDTTPVTTLPDTFNAYLASLDRKSRHELRRKMRRFEEQYPDAAFRVLEGPDVSIPRLLRLMRNDADKQSFLTPEMEQFFLSLPQFAGNMLTQFCVGEHKEPAANTLCFRLGTTLLLYNSGYNPALQNAGFYCKVKAIQWAIDHHYTEFNFLQGNERYKYELGGKDRLVYRVTLTL